MNSLIKKIRKFYKDNTGSAIVMVVVAMAFIAILGATIMWMSLSNYRMKVTDQKNKQGFYTAETVFEQIKVGLQTDVSDAANTAYSYVMQNYSDWNSEAKRKSEYNREFKRSLIKILTEDAAGTSTKYPVSHLAKYIDGNIGISIDPGNHGNPVRYLGASTISGLADTGDIEGISASLSGDETNYIILKGLVLEYTDDEGFYSEISTDVMISAPSTSFLMGRSELPKAFDYALIADQGIEVGESLGVSGGIYAGSDGIRVGEGKTLTVGKASADDKSESNVISKGPLALGKNSTTTINNNYDILKDESLVYFSGISVNQAKLTINSDIRVANDLSITGNGAGNPIKLSGKYSGFGQDQNPPSNDRNDNITSQSSAILINGLNTNIDLSGLRKLILAGRAFVGTRNAKNQEAAGFVPVEPVDVSGNKVFEYDKNNDVKMGESIAAKGNQLAYLVPSECIAVGSNSLKGKNPLTWDEWIALNTEYASNPNIKLVDIDTKISWLDDRPLKYFLEGDTYEDACMTVYVPSNGEILLYFYVKLDENKKMDNGVDRASQYAQWYYEEHKDKMDRYMQAYAPSVTLPASDNIYAAATLISSSGTLKEHTVANALRSQETSACNEYRDKYEVYIINTDRSLSMNKVFENKINMSKLDEFLDDGVVGGRGNNKEFVIPAGEPHEGLKAIVADKTESKTFSHYDPASGSFQSLSKEVYEYKDDTGNARVLISEKDVLLTKPFKGLVITKGKVYTSGSGITVTGLGKGTATSADLKDEISAVLGAQYNPAVLYSDTDPQSWRPINFFMDGFVGVSDDGAGGDDVDIYSSVNFSNWVKR